MQYKNAICDGCGFAFNEDDDIVVCPECGTPQHRSCYQKENKCVNIHLHGTGFEWKGLVEEPKEEPAPTHEKEDPKLIQIVNPSDNGNSVPLGMPTAALDVNPVFYEKAGFAPDTEFDGVKASEAVSYTQLSAKQYVRKFIVSNGKKFFLSWNWGAFFFAPAWFFYRKLYKAGFIFLGIIVALNFFVYPQSQKITNNTEALYEEYAEFTEAFENVSESDTQENEEAFEHQEAELKKLLKELTPSMIAVLTATFFAPNIVAALSADWIYRRKMLSDIAFAKKTTNDSRVLKYALMRRGGVAMLPGLAVLLFNSYLPEIVYSVINYFINLT